MCHRTFSETDLRCQPVIIIFIRMCERLHIVHVYVCVWMYASAHVCVCMDVCERACMRCLCVHMYI